MRTLATSLLLLGMLWLASPATAHVELVFPDPVFDVGETVTFSFVNHGPSTVELVSIPWWQIDRYPEGLLVDGCGTVLPAVTTVGAGESEHGSWNQVECGTSAPAAPGLYRLAAFYGSQELGLQRVQRLFCIGSECEFPTTSVDELVESISWGRAKARYQ